MTADIGRLTSALGERYRIERELGQGGMATVYLAEDLRHKRKVAVKVLKPELAAVLGAERFVHEITTTAALQHPHILPLFDSGTADGFLYYVMPFIDGETLRAKLDRETQLGVDEAVKIASQVADALDYAHRHGVVHRDIKPENILLHDGRPMVADFGIALALSAAAGGRMTETGLSLGTPHYMSPEQATAEKEISGRSDIYSLASVLYEMLAGQPPHLGGSAQQIIMKIIAEQPKAVTTLRKSVPPNVASALAKALEKLPADRFTSAAGFGAALADPRFATAFSSGGDAAEMPRQSLKRLVLIASSATVISLAVAGWAWLRPASESSIATNPWRVQLTLSDSVNLDWGFALSADGSKLVYDGGGHLWLRTAKSMTAVPIAGTEGGLMPSLSPDGKRVAFIRNAASSEELVVVALEGGAAKVLARTDGGIGGVWTDDDHIAFSTFPGYSRIRVSDGTVQPLTTADTSAGEKVHLEASALPGGNGLLFTIPGNNDSTYIAVVGPNGGQHTRLLAGVRATFAPPGHLIVTRSDGSILAMPFDLESRRITGPAVSIISVSPTGIQSTLGRVVVADNGRLIYVAAGRGGLAERPVDLVWMSRAGVSSPVDTNWVGAFSQVVLSRDGKRAAVEEWTANLSHLLVRDMASGSVAEVSLPNTMVMVAAFSLDSRSMYFMGNNRGSHLYRVDPSGAALAERVMTFPGRGLVRTPVLDPSGESVFFTRGSEGADELVQMKLSGTQPVVVPGGQRAFAPQISPDGRWLAFLSNASGRTELHVRSTDLTRSGDWRVATSADLDGKPRWSRGGDELFYVANGSLMAVRVTASPSFEAGVPRALFSTAGLDLSFDVGADGRFLMIRRRPDRRRPTSLVMLERWTDLLPR